MKNPWLKFSLWAMGFVVSVSMFAVTGKPVFAGSATVTGTLKDPNGSGVSSVGVQVHTEDWQISAFANTDSNGAFSVTVENPNFSGKKRMVLDFFVFSGNYGAPPPTFFDLEPGQTKSTGVTQLTASNVTVTIKNSNGTAIENVFGQLRTENFGFFDHRRSDSSGIMKFSTGTTTGKFKIEFDASQATDQTLGAPELIEFTLTTAGETKSFNATMTTPSVVATVLDSSNNGVAEAGCDLSNSNFTEHKFARTDEDGVCRLGKVAAGTYTLFIHAPWKTDGSTYNFSPTDVTVVSGQTTNVTVQNSTPAKTISLTVQTSTGTPITEGKVDCWSTKGFGFTSATLNSSGVAQATVTGGNWECRPMPSGFDHFNKVENPGGGEEGGGGPGGPGGGEGQPGGGGPGGGGPGGDGGNNGPHSIKVKDAKKQLDQEAVNTQWGYTKPPIPCKFANNNTSETCTKTIEVSLFDATITATVKLPDGTAPLGDNFMGFGAFGQTKGEKEHGFGGNFTQVGSGGAVTLAVPAGTYEIEVQSPQYGTPDLEPVSVKSGETAALGNITLIERNVTISGTVVDDNSTAIQYAFVNCFKPFGEGHGFAGGNSDSNGRFSFTATAGKWICAVAPDFSGQATNKYVPSTEPQKFEAAEDESVSLNFIMVPATATIRGKVKLEDGTVVQDIFGGVEARQPGSQELRQEGGPGFMMGGLGGPVNNGSFEFKVPAGTFDVKMFMPFNSEYSVIDTPTVTVEDDETSTGNDITVAPNDATVDIQLVDANGAAVTALDNEVLIFASNSAGAHSLTTSTDGTATLNLSEGTWNVAYATDATESFMNAGTVQVNAVSGETTNVELLMYATGKTITGTVVDPSGDPVANAKVIARVADTSPVGQQLNTYGERSVLTDENGDFSIEVVDKIDGQNVVQEVVVADTQTSTERLEPAKEIVNSGKSEVDLGELAFVTPDITVEGSLGETGAGATVEGYSDSGRYYQTTADDNGDWSFVGTTEDEEIQVNASVTEGATETHSEEVTVGLPKNDEQVTANLDLAKEATLATAEASNCSNTETCSIQTDAGLTIVAPARATSTSEGTSRFSVTQEETKAVDNDFDKPLPGTTFEVSAASATTGSAIETLAGNISITIPLPTSSDFAAGEVNPLDGLDPDAIVPKFLDETSGNWDVVEGGVCEVNTTTGGEIDLEDPGFCTIPSDHLTLFSLTIPQNNAVAQSLSGAEQSRDLVVMPYSQGGPNVRVLNALGEQQESFFAYGSNLRGGFTAMQSDFNGDNSMEIVTVAGRGFGPHLRVFTANGTLVADTFTYDKAFRGGVHVALGDVDGDGTDEIIVAPQGMGGPNVRVYEVNYDAGTITLKDWFFAYQEGFRGGVNVVTGDLNGDGKEEIITSPLWGGGPNVRAYTWNGTGFELQAWTMAYDSTFKGGVDVAAGDVDGDGKAEIVTAPISGGGPNVRVYSLNGSELDLDTWSMVYDEGFKGGVQVEVGNIDSDASDEIVVSPRGMGGPNVRAFNVTNGSMTVIDSVMAYDEAYRSGVNLTLIDIDRDGTAEIVTAPRMGAPNVRVYDADSGEIKLQSWFWGFAETFKGGVNLGI